MCHVWRAGTARGAACHPGSGVSPGAALPWRARPAHERTIDARRWSRTQEPVRRRCRVRLAAPSARRSDAGVDESGRVDVRRWLARRDDQAGCPHAGQALRAKSSLSRVTFGHTDLSPECERIGRLHPDGLPARLGDVHRVRDPPRGAGGRAAEAVRDQARRGARAGARPSGAGRDRRAARVPAGPGGADEADAPVALGRPPRVRARAAALRAARPHGVARAARTAFAQAFRDRRDAASPARARST